MAMVREAAAAGRITALDRDRRIQDLAHASSLDDIEVHLRDLRLPAGAFQEPEVVPAPTVEPALGASSPAEAAPIPRSEPPPGVGTTSPNPPPWAHPAGPALPASNAPAPWAAVGSPRPGAAPAPGPPGFAGFRTRPAAPQFPVRPANRKGCLFAVIAAFVGISLVGPLIGLIGIVSSFDSGSESSSRSVVAKESPELLTRRGWDRMVATLAAEVGSTEVTMATVYDGYAVLMVPSGSRSTLYYYDGALEAQSRGTSTDPAFDLADLSPRLLPGLLRKAGRGVDDVESRYVVVRRDSDSAPTLWVYVNGGGQTGYVQSDFSGRVRYDSHDH